MISGLAIFSLKSHSRLQFDRHANEEDTIRFILRSPLDVRQAPSNSGLRLDDVDPRRLRPAFKRVIPAAVVVALRDGTGSPRSAFRTSTPEGARDGMHRAGNLANGAADRPSGLARGIRLTHPPGVAVSTGSPTTGSMTSDRTFRRWARMHSSARSESRSEMALAMRMCSVSRASRRLEHSGGRSGRRTRASAPTFRRIL